MIRPILFRELGVDADSPTLSDAVGTLPADHARAVSLYLQEGYIIAVSGWEDDVLNPERTKVARKQVQTDGIWVWPSSLAYYVEHYLVGLPDEFIAHVRRNAWRPPGLTTDEVQNIAREFAARA